MEGFVEGMLLFRILRDKMRRQHQLAYQYEYLLKDAGKTIVTRDWEKYIPNSLVEHLNLESFYLVYRTKMLSCTGFAHSKLKYLNLAKPEDKKLTVPLDSYKNEQEKTIFIFFQSHLHVFEEVILNPSSNVFENLLRLFRLFRTVNGSCRISVYRTMLDIMCRDQVQDSMLWREIIESQYLIYGIDIYPTSAKLDFILLNVIHYCRVTNMEYWKQIQRKMCSTYAIIKNEFSILTVFLKYSALNPQFLTNKRLKEHICSYAIGCFNLLNLSPAEVLARIPPSYSRARMFLILHLSYGLYRDRGSKFRNTLDLLFRALPQALISSKELRSVLGSFLPPGHNDTIELICKKFDSVFPTKVPRPRSLQHLCCCAVRRALSRCCMLPEGIDHLDVPRIIHSYLTLDGKQKLSN